ncbi:MAG: hypothetical protein ACPH3N_07320 [Alcanivorax sediminis]|uniref:Tol-pal system protein YbgF n=1 Tax=Alcanivorax sediminis TaxID=2663008 RepID=A0A6N7M246_9GAMM|nr:hypothetical protein [Alcanivorax sediminis]MQX54561.1 hypothetical protein [Alcanivorax sediminis]
MRCLLPLMLPLMMMCGPTQASDDELLTAEQRDARIREQQELEARTRELEAQRQTTQQLLDQQDAYLKALREQIDALKANGADTNTNKEQAEPAGETP